MGRMRNEELIMPKDTHYRSPLDEGQMQPNSRC